MKLVRVDNSNTKKFIQFYEDIYLNKPLKRNSMSTVLKGLLKGSYSICKSTDIEPLMVKKDNEIIMISLLAHAHRMDDYIQISFFEAIENNDEAFKLILDRANDWAKEKGAKKISGSLNIHVNYGLGFLASDYNKWQSFGSAHNPHYYNSFFQENGFTSIDMVSLYKDIRNMEELFSLGLAKRLEKRYSIRHVDFKKLKKEAAIYTKLNNEAFRDHLFYYHREVEEDFELFKELRFFLKDENLLFIEKDGSPVGFMLWYPDFHKLMRPGETIGVETVIKNRLFPNKVRTLKIVEIGVVPSEQNKGAILALFNYLYKCAKDRFDNFETGWILKENSKSLDLSLNLSDGVYKNYKAYVKDVY